ncbi:ADP-ribosylation factor-like protein 6-interacting protein [Echinococcus granulosus]|uniref:ADP-ribosylation factor-like protein 6-interacting protein n=1 Tax=Echinococcus granulosus TaxID=6210 RepID=W6U857_ECHGR|nr:ADP-ribosylation factor-like protein 6-interacting protein [Echinococcus granulosus]EUB57350.1 ADP-ribosylation factor-like protein 6-interacting protein [Echinococcus granulosus]
MLKSRINNGDTAPSTNGIQANYASAPKMSSSIEVCGSDVVRLMADLKDWQKLVVHLECVLTWEKPLVLFYIILIVTLFYALLWTFEPPFLVSLGCLSLCFSLWCYLGPKLALRFLPSVPLTEHNQRYRAFCRRILNGRQLVISILWHLSDLRRRRPYVYAIVCLCGIVNLEILTYDYDGILIAYVLTIIGLLIPGIRHTGVLRIIYLLAKRLLRFIWRIISRVIGFLYSLIPSTQQKTDKKDTGDVAVNN